MITVNNLSIKGLSNETSVFETELAKGLVEAVQRYDATGALELDMYSDAPTLISDAILSGDCTAIPGSENPSLIENTFFLMAQRESLCLDTEAAVEGRRKYWGLELGNVGLTPKLSNFYAAKQSRNALYSALKTYWLGNKDMVANDLNVPALLPAYKLDNGQWTKILAMNPAQVVIPQNSAATEAEQMAMTFDEALAIINKMIDKQSKTMRLASNGEKYIWSTPEIIDVLKAERESNILAGLTLSNVETLYGVFPTIIYKGIQLIDFEHLRQAIRDLKPSVAGTIVLPHRLILTIGLPKIDFQLTEKGNFEDYVTPVVNTYVAGTTFLVAQPEAVNGDFYVVAY